MPSRFPPVVFYTPKDGGPDGCNRGRNPAHPAETTNGWVSLKEMSPFQKELTHRFSGFSGSMLVFLRGGFLSLVLMLGKYPLHSWRQKNLFHVFMFFRPPGVANESSPMAPKFYDTNRTTAPKTHGGKKSVSLIISMEKLLPKSESRFRDFTISTNK